MLNIQFELPSGKYFIGDLKFILSDYPSVFESLDAYENMISLSIQNQTIDIYYGQTIQNDIFEMLGYELVIESGYLGLVHIQDLQQLISCSAEKLNELSSLGCFMSFEKPFVVTFNDQDPTHIIDGHEIYTNLFETSDDYFEDDDFSYKYED